MDEGLPKGPPAQQACCPLQQPFLAGVVWPHWTDSEIEGRGSAHNLWLPQTSPGIVYIIVENK